MKILQLIDVPWDSGLAHYALVLAQGLKKKGHQVYISAVPGLKPWDKAHRLGLKTIPIIDLKGLRALREFIRKHQFDVLNAHTGSTHSLAVAATLGQKIAVVRTRSDARSVRPRFGGGMLFKRTQRVIAAAEYIRRGYIDAVKLPAKKVVTIYQGIDVNDFEAAPLPKSPVLGIVARLDPVKGHRYLLEALSILKPMYPQLRTVIAGQAENISQRELRGVAERLRIDSMIEFAGFRSDIPKLMSQCSIGVIASTGSEAVSRVALEWMAAARAVVATNVGCLSEIVIDRVTGLLVAPKNAPALARALASLLHDAEPLTEMGKAGRERVISEFAMDDFVKRSETVYEEARTEARAR